MSLPRLSRTLRGARALGGHRSSVAQIAVSGAGWWGQGWHLPHLSRHPDAQIAAIIEPNPAPRSSNAAEILETTAALSNRYDAPVFASVEELLSSTVAVDGLLVGTPHATHYEQGQLAIEAGLHVLMEKPMTTSVKEARDLAVAAEAHSAAGRFFAVNNTANWRAATRLATEAVAAGRVGRVQHVACRMHSPLMWLFDDPANVGWTQPQGSNGFAWGQLSHLLAWVFQVTQLQPTKAFATMQQSSRSGADIHDAALIVCEGGATIVLSGSAGLPGDAHGDNPVGKLLECSVFGSEGSLVYGGDDQQPSSGALELRRHDGKPALEVLHPQFEFENYEPTGDGPESLHAFIDACVGRPAYVGADAVVGLRAVQAIDAMYRSASSGSIEECH